MGANVSSTARQHTKALSNGRRAQSIDNLKSDTNQYFHQYHNNNIGEPLHHQTFLAAGDGELPGEKVYTFLDIEKHPPPPDLACLSGIGRELQDQQQRDIYVSAKDRNKFCGSLPNHLDLDLDVGTVDRECETIVKQNDGTLHQPGHVIQALELKLPLLRTMIDAGCDQGYGSERSPEDELPPPLLLMHGSQYLEMLASSSIDVGDGIYNMASALPSTQHNECVPVPGTQQEQVLQQMQPCWSLNSILKPYNFITEDSIFYVQVPKGTRGLGLSVSGGSDSSAPYPGLIRIKRLFPHQAAWATGMLQPGDILLDVNGVSLTGLTNYLALEVLRKATNVVTLTVCRPKDDQYRKLSPATEPPRPPLRNEQPHDHWHGTSSVPASPLPASFPQQQQQSQHFFTPMTAGYQVKKMAPCLPPLEPIQTSFSGEFEIILRKQQGSLGFTLRKEDESVLGHYVRALVREPALSDGRIRPGDKIVAVNDVQISPMSHEEAVIFLRQAADVVRLRLYRDQAQTPVCANSPNPSSCGGRPKARLRPEAINLLTDLAASRYHRAAIGSGSSVASSNTNSPRRLRRAGGYSAEFDNLGFQEEPHHQCLDETYNYWDTCSNASTIVSQVVDNLEEESYYCDEEIDAIVASEESSSATQQQQYPQDDGHTARPRPTFLDLDAGSTASFQLGTTGTAAMQQLNNLDHATLDAPLQYGLTGSDAPGPAGSDSCSANFISLPCETLLVACKTEQDLQNGDQKEAIYVQHFRYKSPLYSSINVPARIGDVELVEAVESRGTNTLVKWKGATLPSDEVERLFQTQPDTEPANTDDSNAADDTDATSCVKSTTGSEPFELNANCGTDSEGNQIFTVELNKGWNSRLGFSLRQDSAVDGCTRTVISAIYRNSVAARDGRLRVGDVLIMVNEEPVESVPTAHVIELMRIVRGAIFITLLRPSGSNGTTGTFETLEEKSVDEMNIELVQDDENDVSICNTDEVTEGNVETQ